jgi:hypothetical protein
MTAMGEAVEMAAMDKIMEEGTPPLAAELDESSINDEGDPDFV